MATTATHKPRTGRRRVHPLVAASTLLPVGLGLVPSLNQPSTPESTSGATRTAVSSGVIGASCKLPFDAIKLHHPIDDSCSADGAAKPDTPQSQQNDMKNNFCSTGTPVNIDFDDLQTLMRDASQQGITFGSDMQLPKVRSVLRNLPTKHGNLSEGDVVRIAAFVFDAHGSNLSGGESVNCKQGGAENNDIHIVLSQTSAATQPNQDECQSVTAEMSPHFRPGTWTPDALNQHNTHLYRFTGQLFFDASHRPCSGSQGAPPKRSSIWEVHPVYAVEICTDTQNKCTVDSDQGWISFAEEEGEVSSETRLQLPDEIEKTFGGSNRQAPSR